MEHFESPLREIGDKKDAFKEMITFEFFHCYIVRLSREIQRLKINRHCNKIKVDLESKIFFSRKIFMFVDNNHFVIFYCCESVI